MRAAVAALVGLVALAAASPARADGAAAALTTAPAGKKQLFLAGKAVVDAAGRVAYDKALARRIGRPPEAVVNVVNTWTDETVVLPATGTAALAPDAVDRFLRCHFTNQPARMDARLFAAVVQAARSLGSRRVEIVSGFRAPKYNLMLRKKGHEVARDSQHTKGHAVDFRLVGVPTERLRRWALKLGLGGVGVYPSSGFVHVDVGPRRQWNGE